MAEDDYGRVPAGWYPDPLGLPQLRWWDNTAWTEHVSDARQPMVPSEAPTAPAAPTMFADDDLPRRRDLRTASTPEDAPLDDPAREGSAPEQPGRAAAHRARRAGPAVRAAAVGRAPQCLLCPRERAARQLSC